MNLSNPVSGRQFAKMVGQSESAVRKAVDRHSIVAGKNADGKFIPEIAAREWGKPILPEFGGIEIVSNIVIEKKTIKPAIQKPKLILKKEKPLPVTVEDFLSEDEDDLPEVTPEEISSTPDSLNGNSSKIDADRFQSIYKAKMAELAYLERKGDMIPRAKLRVLFDYGANIRTAIKGIRSRILDEILANSNDRQVCARLFDEEIDRTLEELSDLEKLNI